MTIRMTSLSNEVHVADEAIPTAGRSEIDFLKDRVRESPLRRSRLCTHRNLTDSLHEMFIVFAQGTYVRPSKHLHEDESLHILEGLADYVCFDEQGRVDRVIRLGDYRSGQPFYCRTPASVFHTLLLVSDLVVAHEAREGPLTPSNTVFPPWAPHQDDAPAVGRFVETLERAVAAWRA